MGDDEFVLLGFALPDDATPRLSPPLTAAERAVLALVIEGFSTRAIADARGTSPRTVGHQLAAIYRKVGVRSRRELRALAAVTQSAATR